MPDPNEKPDRPPSWRVILSLRYRLKRTRMHLEYRERVHKRAMAEVSERIASLEAELASKETV